MSEVLQIFLITLVIVVISASLAAMLMMFVVFPLINKIFKTKLPSYDFSHIKDVEIEEMPKEKNSNENQDDKNSVDKNKKQVAKTVNKTSIESSVNLKDNKTETALEPKKVQTRYVDFHKDVPTVKLPPIIKNMQPQTLTLSKIDAAARAAVTPKQPKDLDETSEVVNKQKTQVATSDANKTDSGVGTVALPSFDFVVKEVKKPAPNSKNSAVQKTEQTAKNNSPSLKTVATKKSENKDKSVKSKKDTK